MPSGTSCNLCVVVPGSMFPTTRPKVPNGDPQRTRLSASGVPAAWCLLTRSHGAHYVGVVDTGTEEFASSAGCQEFIQPR
jgi:hypothetical protein